MTNSKLAELQELHSKLAVRDCGAGGPWDQEPIAWAIGEIERLSAGLPKLEFAEHCGCCTRNKITLEVFGPESGAPQGEAGDRAGPQVSTAAGLVSQPPGSSSQLPINRALVRALDCCVIPLLQGSVSVENRSPDPVVVTVDRAAFSCT